MARRHYILLALLILGHWVIDLIAPLAFFAGQASLQGAVVLAIMGVSFSQIDLLALWATLAPGPVVLRLPWSLLLAVLAWNAVLLGSRLFMPAYFQLNASASIMFGGAILAGLGAALVPLWTARQFFRWRLVLRHAASATGAAGNSQFSLTQLMLGMLLCSLALAVTRWSIPAEEELQFEGVAELAIFVALFTIVNLILALPCVWAAFTRPSYWPLWGIIWLVYAAVITVCEAVTLQLLLGGRTAEFLQLCFAFSFLNLGQGVSLFINCVVLRAAGFQFVREGVLLTSPPTTTDDSDSHYQAT